MSNLDNLRHSLAHLLATASLQYDPNLKLAIGPIIDNGFYYDIQFSKPFSNEMLPTLQQNMISLIKQNLSFERIETTANEAKKQFKDQPFKIELINELENAGATITLYKTGDFIDLCKGGHIENTKEIPIDAFELTHIAGAYWRGDEKNIMLTRVYGLAFETKEMLEEYKKQQAEAKLRDHRLLGEKLQLFMISDEVGKGLPLWLPNGAFIRKKLEDFIFDKELANGYQYVNTPILTHKRLYEKSGHLAHYKDDMYNPIEIEGEEYYLRPMNCPHHHQIFKHRPLSYRDLPIRLAEFGLVHRFERSGVLTGLIRSRGFTQNDSHIYCDKKDLQNEIINVLKLFKEVFDDVFQIKEYWFRLSLPDFSNTEKFGDIKNKKMWDEAATVTRNSLIAFAAPFVEVEGEASFYGPKIDIQMKNVAGKEDTIATIQIDFYSSKRSNLEFTNSKGEKEEPVIIHRAILGSFERFFALLTEHCAGAFPVWLSRVQVQILSVTEKQKEYVKNIADSLIKDGVRVETNVSDEMLGKKVKCAKEARVPYFLIIGEKEMTSQTVTVESHKHGKIGVMSLVDFINRIKKEVQNKTQ